MNFIQKQEKRASNSRIMQINRNKIINKTNQKQIVHFFLKKKQPFMIETMVNKLRAGFVYGLKTSISTIYFLSHTVFYLLYILFAIVGFFAPDKSSILHFLCKNFVFALIFFCLVFLLVLNLPATNKRVGRLIGHLFLERYLPGKCKGLFPLVMFISTFSFLNFVEDDTILSRLTEFGDSLDLIYIEIDKIKTATSGSEAADAVNKVVSLVNEMPYRDYPKTGLITDIASYLSVF